MFEVPPPPSLSARISTKFSSDFFKILKVRLQSCRSCPYLLVGVLSWLMKGVKWGSVETLFETKNCELTCDPLPTRIVCTTL